MSAAAIHLTPSTHSVRWLLRSDSAQARMARFMAIGWASTGLYWTLFLALTPALTATWAALVSLASSTLINTAAQRRFTFDSSSERGTAGRDHVMSLTVFFGSWLLSVWALGILASLVASPSAVAQLAVAQACTLVGSAVRFTLLHTWNRH